MQPKPNETAVLQLKRGRGERAAWVIAILLGLTIGTIACHHSTPPRRPEHQPPTEDHIPIENCLGEGNDERGQDVDGDGDSDLTHVFRGEARVCTAMDMNFDGHVDLVRFYEEDGTTPRLELHDFDFDSRIDQVSQYENGERVRQELDTDFDDRMDLSIRCEHGVATHVQRDRLHHGQIDTWETYEGGFIHEAKYDEDRNGEPERFEYYRDGLLVAEALDRNGDNELSEEERWVVEAEFSGVAHRLLCDPALAASAAAAAAAHPEEAPEEVTETPAPAADLDAGVPSAASSPRDAGPIDAAGLAPWELPDSGTSAAAARGRR